MKILNGSVMASHYPMPQTRGQLVALYKSAIAPQLQRVGINHSTVRDWLRLNIGCDTGTADILTSALRHIQESAL